MRIYSYDKISKHEINATRTTSEGKIYSLNHPDELVINMRYKGGGKGNVNSQGWERSSSYYFKELLAQHPEYFSKKNRISINAGKSPVIDKRFTDNFPQYSAYKGETIVHHHIGQDGQAVALPQSVHKGYGEIHAVEHELGITARAQSFSKYCDEACRKDFLLYGQTSDKFQSVQNRRDIQGAQNNALASEHKSDVFKNSAFAKATHSPQARKALSTAGRQNDISGQKRQ